MLDIRKLCKEYRTLILFPHICEHCYQNTEYYGISQLKKALVLCVCVFIVVLTVKLKPKQYNLNSKCRY